MWTCTICRFATELDDVVVRTGPATGVCLGCFHRQTGTTMRMPKALRRELLGVLAVVDTPA
jgi:hypothetical protein